MGMFYKLKKSFNMAMFSESCSTHLGIFILKSAEIDFLREIYTGYRPFAFRKIRSKSPSPLPPGFTAFSVVDCVDPEAVELLPTNEK